MLFELVISKIAFYETDNAYRFYEAQSPGLGERFLTSLENAYKKLSYSPQFYSYINSAKDLRDIKIDNFPFVIIFQIIKNQVFVLRVFNTNRDSLSIKNLI